jgi:hypothetical protein
MSVVSDLLRTVCVVIIEDGVSASRLYQVKVVRACGGDDRESGSKCLLADDTFEKG